MNTTKKEKYEKPVLTKHDPLRDVTAKSSTNGVSLPLWYQWRGN
jgi:hypothetical protein